MVFLHSYRPPAWQKSSLNLWDKKLSSCSILDLPVAGFGSFVPKICSYQYQVIMLPCEAVSWWFKEGMEWMEWMEWTFIAVNNWQIWRSKKKGTHITWVSYLAFPKKNARKNEWQMILFWRKKSIELSQPLDIQGHLLRKSCSFGAPKNIPIQTAFTSGGIRHNV